MSKICFVLYTTKKSKRGEELVMTYTEEKHFLIVHYCTSSALQMKTEMRLWEKCVFEESVCANTRRLEQSEH